MQYFAEFSRHSWPLKVSKYGTLECMKHAWKSTREQSVEPNHEHPFWDTLPSRPRVWLETALNVRKWATVAKICRTGPILTPFMTSWSTHTAWSLGRAGIISLWPMSLIELEGQNRPVYTGRSAQFSSADGDVTLEKAPVSNRSCHVHCLERAKRSSCLWIHQISFLRSFSRCFCPSVTVLLIVRLFQDPWRLSHVCTRNILLSMVTCWRNFTMTKMQTVDKKSRQLMYDSSKWGHLMRVHRIRLQQRLKTIDEVHDDGKNMNHHASTQMSLEHDQVPMTKSVTWNWPACSSNRVLT